MSVPGGYFVTEEFFSPARFNRKCATHLTGDEIAILSPTYPNQIVVCTATGSGFTQDTMYIRNSSNTNWIGGSGGMHLHDTATDASGGLLSDIIYANLMKVYWDNVMTPTAGQFNVINSGGASALDVHPNLLLSTGTSAGAWTHIGRAGVGVAFNFPSRFIIRQFTSNNTFLTARMGVYSERVDSETAAVPAKYGLEVCDSAGTPRNWDVFSSDATTRTADTSTANVAAVSPTAYRLDYAVATDIKFFVNGTINITKTLNVPAGGGSINGRTTGVGIKTNNTVNKTLSLSGMAFAGIPSTTAWS